MLLAQSSTIHEASLPSEPLADMVRISVTAHDVVVDVVDRGESSDVMIDVVCREEVSDDIGLMAEWLTASMELQPYL